MKAFDVSGSKNKEFWFSHLLIVLATVFAVYLAASAGLKSAISFELVKSDKDSYYMRKAFLHELEDNISNIQSWSTQYKGGQAGKFKQNPQDYVLDTYVWESMKQQSSTFEIPSSILTNVRRYYGKSIQALSKMISGKPAANIVDQIQNESKKMQTETVNSLKEDINTLEAKLKNYNVL